MVTAFAPATVANVGVGFDVLGFALDGVGDRVSVARGPAGSKDVVIDAITGVVTDLPVAPEHNTASVALRSLLAAERLEVGLRVRVDKGIPLGSGMGGSAASAVAAVVAANRLLGLALDRAALLGHAIAGEAAASGAPHADNAAPCLHGGMVAVVAREPLRVVDVPVPRGLSCVLVHPDVRVDTREARAALAPDVPLVLHVEQTMYLAGFLAGCYGDDPDLVERSLVDRIVGPQRATRIPGFDAACRAARRAGAPTLAIAGSGPSVFTWTRSEAVARAVADAVGEVFAAEGLAHESWIGPLGVPGARVIEEEG